MNRQTTEDFQVSETILYNNTMADTYYYTCVKTHKICIKNEVSCRLQTQGSNDALRQIHHCNKCTTLVNNGGGVNNGGDVNNAGGCVYVEREAMWELCVLSAQLYGEPKISIIIKFIN